MKTAIIIVNYNDYDSTSNLINSIKDYKIIEKIVIVDNNSSKEEKNKLQKIKHDKVKIIYNDENKGYSAAINIGSKYLIEEYGKCNIIVSNSDVIINKEKDIKELVKILVRKDVGVVGPVILETNCLNRGWKLSTAKQEILFNIPKLYRRFERKYRFYNEEHYEDSESIVDVVSGCFFLIKSQVLEQIGFLDENVFLYYEENILAKKIKKLNLKEIIANNIIVIHNHAVTINKNVSRINKHKILKESQYYYVKEYCNPSKFGLWCLKVSSKLANFFFRIYYINK